MKLALDHHFSPLIASGLRARGHDVVTLAEVGWEAEDDEDLLTLCADDGRALLTNNVADFAVIGRRWQSDNRSHEGLVFTSDASMPRTRDNVGRFVDLLDEFLRNHKAPGNFVDRTHWL